MIVLLMKLMVVACVVGMLRTSTRFQSMSRELDDAAISAVKRFMAAAEDRGFPREMVPFLMLLTGLTLMTAMVTMGAGR